MSCTAKCLHPSSVSILPKPRAPRERTVPCYDKAITKFRKHSACVGTHWSRVRLSGGRGTASWTDLYSRMLTPSESAGPGPASAQIRPPQSHGRDRCRHGLTTLASHKPGLALAPHVTRSTGSFQLRVCSFVLTVFTRPVEAGQATTHAARRRGVIRQEARCSGSGRIRQGPYSPADRTSWLAPGRWR